MFSFRREEILPVEAYGKLPIAKDYLRVGCAEGAPGLWREWLDRAYSGSAGGVFPALAWPARFVTGQAWGEPTVGALWPSSDAGGLRKFPITFLVERRAKLARADLDAGWPATGALWQALGELKREAESQPDGRQFLATLRGRELEVDKLPSPRGESVDFAAWKRAIDAGADGLERIFRRLDELRRGGPRKQLRLPLVSNLDLVAQAHAWHGLVREIGVLPSGELFTVLFPYGEPDGDVPAFAVVSARRWTSDDASWLQAPRADGASGVEDLCDARALRAESAAESAQPLVNSLRGAWTAFGARRA